MRLERLRISQFRNLNAVDLRLDPKINFFFGANGQGKTSVLESISLLSSLKSFRDSKPWDWIQRDRQESEIEGWFVPDGLEGPDAQAWTSRFRVTLTQEGGSDSRLVKKVAEINGKPVRSGSGFLRKKFGSAELALHTISFNPSDHDLVRGEPSERRQYLDRVLAAENLEYLEALLQYSRLLDQRNALLKETGRRLSEILTEFTLPLIQYGSWILLKRLEWLQTNAPRIAQIAGIIAPNQEILGVSYHPKALHFPDLQTDKKNKEIEPLNEVHFTGHHPLPSLQEIKKRMESGFSALAADELRQGVTLLGPHRDDWALTGGGIALKGRGSQGEIRTALMALKLTEIESFRRVTRHQPILLLDDFSSELDLQRRQYLMQFIEKTDLQVLITSTEAAGLPGKKFNVSSGVIESAVNF